MPAIPGIRVSRSRIHGYGVFATRDFATDEVIAEVDGVKVASETCENDDYCLYVDEHTLFDMVDQTRWINHSCEPNSGVDVEMDADGQVHAAIVALRPIRAGEELTYDYAFPEALAVPCQCGAARCRGFIVDEDELDDLRARLAAERAVAGTGPGAQPSG